jgi:uncharacterized membrane protein
MELELLAHASLLCRPTSHDRFHRDLRDHDDMDVARPLARRQKCDRYSEMSYARGEIDRNEYERRRMLLAQD